MPLPAWTTCSIGSAGSTCWSTWPPSGGEHELVDEADWESWRQAFEVNVIGTLELSRCAGRAMRAAGGGSIVQIGTQGTHALPSGRARYTATKAAMVSASLTLAKELGPWGVRVNVVTPGLHDGGAARRHDRLAGGPPRHLDGGRRRPELAASASLRRHVEPSDVAEAVLFLAGPGARAITGMELPVTAGR